MDAKTPDLKKLLLAALEDDFCIEEGWVPPECIGDGAGPAMDVVLRVLAPYLRTEARALVSSEDASAGTMNLSRKAAIDEMRVAVNRPVHGIVSTTRTLCGLRVQKVGDVWCSKALRGLGLALCVSQEGGTLTTHGETGKVTYEGPLTCRGCISRWETLYETTVTEIEDLRKKLVSMCELDSERFKQLNAATPFEVPGYAIVALEYDRAEIAALKTSLSTRPPMTLAGEEFEAYRAARDREIAALTAERDEALKIRMDFAVGAMADAKALAGAQNVVREVREILDADGSESLPEAALRLVNARAYALKVRDDRTCEDRLRFTEVRMTVAELLRQLAKYDPSASVMVGGTEGAPATFVYLEGVHTACVEPVPGRGDFQERPDGTVGTVTVVTLWGEPMEES